LGLRIRNPFFRGSESFGKHLGLGFMTNGQAAHRLYCVLSPLARVAVV
jgi:hypothetical protein